MQTNHRLSCSKSHMPPSRRISYLIIDGTTSTLMPSEVEQSEVSFFDPLSPQSGPRYSVFSAAGMCPLVCVLKLGVKSCW